MWKGGMSCSTGCEVVSEEVEVVADVASIYRGFEVLLKCGRRSKGEPSCSNVQREGTNKRDNGGALRSRRQNIG